MCVETEKITPRHRERHAYVYVRQSSPKQVQHNRESQRTQYALVERAAALGWPSARVHVIDADLGQSGQDGQRRGFQELVAEVSLGRVGLILAYEASRLARSNADWYALLDLAAVVGALIADAEGVYDPRSYNDRLLLGLRGMLSEAELHLLQMRMAAGRQRQIERGAYRQRLPTGLVRLPDGRAVKDPDLTCRCSAVSAWCSPSSLSWGVVRRCCGGCATTASGSRGGRRVAPMLAS
jgi:DNA invertase Pin-like site-specific DNA recombinase